MNFQKYFEGKGQDIQITDARFQGIKDIQSGNMQGRRGNQKLAVYDLTINGRRSLPVYLDGMGVVFIKRTDSQLNYSANLMLDDPFYRPYEMPPELDKSKAKEIEGKLIGNTELERTIAILLNNGKIQKN